jgi:acetyltransferase-like isoleucine patch superfamily enzyme
MSTSIHHTVQGAAAPAVGGVAPPAWRRSLAKLSLLGPALAATWYLRSAQQRGARVTLRGRLRVSNRGRLTIGGHVRLVSTLAKSELATLPGGHIEIGDNVFVNFGTSIVSSAHVKIGNDCLIGTHVTIMDCDFHRVEDKAWDTSGEPIVLQDRVWLGNRSIILKGVTIGHDSVVAAGAVVTRDVPPRVVAAGNPARVVREF